MVGEIKHYDAKKGYGFISAENKQVFFMRKDIAKNHQHCSYKEAVAFDIIRDTYGVRAVNIRRII